MTAAPSEPVAVAGSTIGVDVGGTTIKGLLRGHDGSVLREHRVATPAPDPEGRRVCAAVARVAAELGHRPGDPLGVAVPGVVDEAAGLVRRAVNLGWHDLPVRDLLVDHCGPDVVLGHDVRAGAVAEYRTGAAVGRRGVVVFVAIGTGIAAGILVDGVAVSSDGWAGEIGQLVLADGPFTGRRFEEVASASATARRAGMSDARSVVIAVRAGDQARQAVWDGTVEVLAQSLAGLVCVLGPATVVLGGGLALAGDLLRDPVRARLAELVPVLRLPDIRTAVHGDRAAALGMSLLATDRSGAARG